MCLYRFMRMQADCAAVAHTDTRIQVHQQKHNRPLDLIWFRLHIYLLKPNKSLIILNYGVTLKVHTCHILRHNKLTQRCSFYPERILSINKAIILPHDVKKKRSFKPRVISGSIRRQQMAFQAACIRSAQ